MQDLISETVVPPNLEPDSLSNNDDGKSQSNVVNTVDKGKEYPLPLERFL